MSDIVSENKKHKNPSDGTYVDDRTQKRPRTSAKLEQGLEALEAETKPELFDAWIATHKPTEESLQSLLELAIDKHGRHDWVRLYKAIKAQKEKESTHSNLTKLLKEIVQCLTVRNEHELNACKKMAWKLLRRGTIDSCEGALKKVVDHRDVSGQPSVITFLSELIYNDRPLSSRWSCTLEKAVATYIQPLFQREGLSGYSRAINNLDRFAPNWRWNSLCKLENVWKEVHNLSGAKTPFIIDDYDIIHDMAKTVKVATDKFEDSFWESYFSHDGEDIVDEVMSDM